MAQRRRFARVELDEIRHLIAQTEDSEPDGPTATVTPELLISARPKIETRPQRLRRPGRLPQANSKSDHVSKRI